MADHPLEVVEAKLQPSEAPGELAAWQRPDLWLFERIESLERNRGELVSAVVVAVIAEAISFLFASTTNDYFRARFTGLSANPFAHGPVPIPFPEHRLRLLGPVLAWLLGLRGYAGAYLPIAFNVPLLTLVYVVVRRRTTLPLAVTLTLLMATTHLTMSSRTLIGYHDTMVFLCAAAAMVCPSVVLSVVFFFLGMFGDPRIVLMIPMLFVWWVTQSGVERPWRSALIRGAAQAALVPIYLGLSYVLLRVFEYQAHAGRELARYFSGEYFRAMMPSYFQLSAFMTFKAAWLLAFGAIWLGLSRRRFLSLVLAGNLVMVLAAGLLVYDFSRALAFCFPVVMLGAIALHATARRAALTVVGTCYMINLITPFYQGMTTGLWIQSYPLPANILLWLAGR